MIVGFKHPFVQFGFISVIVGELVPKLGIPLFFPGFIFALLYLFRLPFILLLIT